MVVAHERPVSSEGSAAPSHPSDALYAEWAAANPSTPAEIEAFYRDAEHYPQDLDAWHATPERRSWTDALVHVATGLQAERIVDIGCGAGHDLAALRAALPLAMLFGVDPNHVNRARASAHADGVFEDAAMAPVEVADVLVCFDVLEHVPDPEAFLTSIAERARLGCIMVETTATQDLDCPLHLNPGWHPGHALEAAGWTLLEQRDRLRVWQRLRPVARPVATVTLCSWRAVTIPTMLSLLNLAGVQGWAYDEDDELRLLRVSESPWRIGVKAGDGLIQRSRSIIASRWYAETASDVLLFVDDDISFEPEDAEKLVAACRERRAIVCGAYPVGDASKVAIRGFDGRRIDWSYTGGLIEIEYGSTGMMAIHRDVMHALVTSGRYPLCHADTEYAYWPVFACVVAPMGKTYGELSEDWSFCLRARHHGVPTLLDPTVRVGHVKEQIVTVDNMDLIAQAIQERRGRHAREA